MPQSKPNAHTSPGMLLSADTMHSGPMQSGGRVPDGNPHAHSRPNLWSGDHPNRDRTTDCNDQQLFALRRDHHRLRTDSLLLRFVTSGADGQSIRYNRDSNRHARSRFGMHSSHQGIRTIAIT